MQGCVHPHVPVACFPIEHEADGATDLGRGCPFRGHMDDRRPVLVIDRGGDGALT